MSKAKRYTSVSEMVHALSEDRAFAGSFDKRIAERQVIKLLISLRAVANKSQKDIADAMNCTQSRISKLESGKDGDLRLKDLHGYLAAAGYDMKIVIGKQGQTTFDEVKYHAFSVKRLLDHLAHRAGDDETMARGVLKAIGETWYNLAKMLDDSAKKLEVRSRHASAAIAVEMQETEEAADNGKKRKADDSCETSAK